MKSLAVVVLAALTTLAVHAADSKPMTNQDVIGLVKAKISEDVITAAIKGSAPGFDTSPAGIVKLATAGVPEKIIKAMIEADRPTAKPEAAAVPAAPAVPAFNPEEVLLVDEGTRSTMRYLNPQTRIAARALGMGGIAHYAALKSTQAQLRLKNKQPEFIVAVPSNAQAESYYTLASLAVRGNGTREVLIGGGYMSYSSGIAHDRIVATTSEKMADQSAAPKGFILYTVKVKAPLPAGEYAFILYNSQVKVSGFFVGGNDSYYDFGVDA